MVRRLRLTALAVVMLLGATLLPSQSVSAASSEYITGTIYQNRVVYFLRERIINPNGWYPNGGIYFNKTDGPAIDLTWYKCGVKSNRGSCVFFPNPDPTGTKYIDSGFLPDTPFCLMAVSYGNNYQDTFSGYLYWNY